MAGKVRISPIRWIFLGLLVTGFIAIVGYVIWLQARAPKSPHQGTQSIYNQDTPLATMPDRLIIGLIQLRPEEIVKIPFIDGFESPIGADNGAMAYDAQPFGSPNPQRGGNHCGQDLNGIGGQNTDEGDPVRAAARGLVVYCGKPSPGWGNVVVLAHRIPGDARIIQTIYAHLKDINVAPGRLIPRGTKIGSIGTADGQYLAHLHFEMVASRCVEGGMPGYSPKGVMNRLDPEELMNHHPAPPHPDVYDSIRRLRIREAALQAPTDNKPAAVPEGAIPVTPSQFL